MRFPIHLFFDAIVHYIVPCICHFIDSYFILMHLIINSSLYPDKFHYACCTSPCTSPLFVHIVFLEFIQQSISQHSCRWLFLSTIALAATSIALTAACFLLQTPLYLGLKLRLQLDALESEDHFFVCKDLCISVDVWQILSSRFEQAQLLRSVLPDDFYLWCKCITQVFPLILELNTV